MARSTWAGLLFLLAAMSGVAAGVDREQLARLRSPDARAAFAEYDRAMFRVQEEDTKQAVASRKKLLADLESAQTKATNANQLDDAVLIREIRKSVEEEAPAKTRWVPVTWAIKYHP